MPRRWPSVPVPSSRRGQVPPPVPQAPLGSTRQCQAAEHPSSSTRPLIRPGPPGDERQQLHRTHPPSCSPPYFRHASERTASDGAHGATGRPMTGPDHFREAERLLQDCRERGQDWASLGGDALAFAQVHATLALAAAVALGTSAAEGPTRGDVAGQAQRQELEQRLLLTRHRDCRSEQGSSASLPAMSVRVEACEAHLPPAPGIDWSAGLHAVSTRSPRRLRAWLVVCAWQGPGWPARGAADMVRRGGRFRVGMAPLRSRPPPQAGAGQHRVRGTPRYRRLRERRGVRLRRRPCWEWAVTGLPGPSAITPGHPRSRLGSPSGWRPC